MQPHERIEVRKIYLGSAAKFGLMFGLIAGIIAAIIVFVIGMLGVSLLSPGLGFGYLNFTGTTGLAIAAGVILIIYFLSIFISSLIFALLYNLSAKMGGMLHIGLAEYEAKVKPMKPENPADKLNMVGKENKKAANVKKNGNAVNKKSVKTMSYHP